MQAEHSLLAGAGYGLARGYWGLQNTSMAQLYPRAVRAAPTPAWDFRRGGGAAATDVILVRPTPAMHQPPK